MGLPSLTISIPTNTDTHAREWRPFSQTCGRNFSQITLTEHGTHTYIVHTERSNCVKWWIIENVPTFSYCLAKAKAICGTISHRRFVQCRQYRMQNDRVRDSCIIIYECTVGCVCLIWSDRLNVWVCWWRWASPRRKQNLLRASRHDTIKIGILPYIVRLRACRHFYLNPLHSHI